MQFHITSFLLRFTIHYALFEKTQLCELSRFLSLPFRAKALREIFKNQKLRKKRKEAEKVGAF